MKSRDRPLSRRHFLRGAGSVVVCGGSAVVLADAWWIEPRRIVVERHRVALRHLPAAFHGFRIAHLSDFHFGQVVKLQHLRNAVQLANSLKPDLICLTGDFVSASVSYAAPCTETLRDLSAPHGVYAVLGNHDHWTEADAVQHALKAAGISVLRNQWTAIRHRSETLPLLGVGDVWVGDADLTQATRGLDPAQCTVSMVHEPDFADEVRRHPVDLQLSGHTHGGQVWLPGIGAPVLPPYGRQYPRGWYRFGRLQLYVNRGVGLIMPPLRLNCPAEVALLELAPDESRPAPQA